MLGDGYHVSVGVKYRHTYITQAVNEIPGNGRARVIALALAPHYSKFSIDCYAQRVRSAVDAVDTKLDLTFVESWNYEPLFIASPIERMRETVAELNVADRNDISVIFSAHGPPERILQGGDPYPQELLETYELAAAQLGLKQDGWRLMYQSAGRTGEKWLGPNILDTLDAVAQEGHKHVTIAPVWFVAGHLEVLYDIDVECAERARFLGIELQRIPSANASPVFVAAFAGVVAIYTVTAAMA